MLELSNGVLTKTLLGSLTLIGVLIMLLYGSLTNADDHARACIEDLQKTKADKETVVRMADQIESIYHLLIGETVHHEPVIISEGGVANDG